MSKKSNSGKNKNENLPWEHPRFSSWVAVARVNQMVKLRLADALLSVNLDLPSYDVLAAAYRFDGLTQSELAEKLLIGRSNLSMLLPELENKEWLRREPDSNDKRIRRVYLTSKGKKKAVAGVTLQAKLIDHMMASTSDAECDAIGEMMRKIILYMEKTPFNP